MNKRELFPYSNRGSQLCAVDAVEEGKIKELNKIFSYSAVSFLRLPENSKKRKKKEKMFYGGAYDMQFFKIMNERKL